MPEYLAPGVYIEEFELGPRPIEGVATSTAGFLGVTRRGPLEARLVTGFEDFKRVYGGYMSVDDSSLAFAVDGFFRNGGQRLYVGRIAPSDATETTLSLGPLIIEAVGPGSWGDRIALKIDPPTLQNPDEPRFKLTVMYWDERPATLVDPTDPNEVTNADRVDPTILEIYDNLTSIESSVDFYERRITGNSNLIDVRRGGEGNPPEQELGFLPEIGGTAGSDGSDITVDDYVGRLIQPPAEAPEKPSFFTGLAGFEQVDEIAIVAAPDHHREDEITTRVIEHCEKLKDRFAVIHSRRGQDTLNDINAIAPPRDSQYAAFYFPWIKVFNPLRQQDSLIPPTGHIVGIYAKTDIERGVFKAPANVVVSGANGLEFQITKGHQDILNPKGVNCIRSFPQRGIRVWGARTSSTNSLWKYISVRRLFIFIEESIEEGTQWVVFEPNDQRLWARVRQTITQFLTTQWRDGALMGATPEEAFFVKVDETTMTVDDRENGRLICIIGIAPVKPAEFVIFRLTQFAGGSDIAEL